MNYFYSIVFAFFFQVPTLLLSQDSTIDSLKAVISSAPDDSAKVNNLIAMANLLLNTNPRQAVDYGEQAKTLAEKIGFQMGLGYAFKVVGLGYVNQSNYPEALLQYQNSLDIFKAINDKMGIANVLTNIGVVYFNTGDDTKAIEYHLQSLKVAEEINNKKRIGTALNNIGGVYNNKPGTVDKALEYYIKALPLFEEIKYNDGIGTITGNIGEIYLAKGEYEKALPYFEKALEIYSGTIDATFPLTFLGQIFAERKDFPQALNYHHQSIKIAEKMDAKLELAQALLGLGNTLIKQNKTKEAIAAYTRAKNISESVKNRKEMKTAYEELAKVYANEGDFKNAFIYEQLLTGIKDTLFNNDEVNKIQQLQFNFDIEKKQSELNLKDLKLQRQEVVSYAAGITGFLLLILAVGTYNRYKYVRKTNKIIKAERDKSEELLLNILPAETAKELETKGYASTRYYENVTVLFTDFKGFSSIAGRLSPQDLVAELNDYFMAFDDITGKFNLEKIKTIGDAFMCAGGIPTPNTTHPLNAVNAALAMQEYMQKKIAERKAKGFEIWELRIGVHTGPIVAGVVGKKKYAYDIWGDTVNIASRMESTGEPGKVNISATTYNLIKDEFNCSHRGKITAKNIGEIDMYFVGDPKVAVMI